MTANYVTSQKLEVNEYYIMRQKIALILLVMSNPV